MPNSNEDFSSSSAVELAPVQHPAEVQFAIGRIGSIHDTKLQAMNSRRRYARRGSRSPRMLILNCKQLSQNDDCDISMADGTSRKRRLSVVSSMILEFEASTRIEAKSSKRER